MASRSAMGYDSSTRLYCIRYSVNERQAPMSPESVNTVAPIEIQTPPVKPGGIRRRFIIAIVFVCLGFAVVIGLLISAVEKVKEAAPRMQSINNLKQIGMGIHNYDSASGQLPPQAICDLQGNKLLSWRVAILPYLECSSQYSEFKHDEPWDSPHNIAQVSKMPKIYCSPTMKAEKGETCYKVFAGRNTAFGMFQEDEKNYPRSIWSIESLTKSPRGTSELVLCVEAGDPVIWTKPEDIDYNPEHPFPELKPIYKGGILTLKGDGSVLSVRKSLKESAWRAAIEPNSASNESIDQ
jgi:hypothetical protein